METVNGKSYPAFYALNDIQPMTELVYNYGGTGYPWRKKSRAKGEYPIYSLECQEMHSNSSV